jgi:hypothetical protein
MTLIKATALAAAAFFAVAGGTGAARQTSSDAHLPKAGQAGAWAPSAPPERYVRESLYGYIDGGAELVLPYGFEEVAVGRYRRPGDSAREITVEIYRTASSLDAFGLFSLQRDGREDVSATIHSAHWLSPTQACLARGRYYVNLVGDGTDEADLAGMLKAVEALIPGPSASGLDPRFDALPSEGRIPRSERYIKGDGAARAETQFFSDPAWGFGLGATAVSARYEPGDAKLIVIETAGEAAGLDAAVRDQFAANLEGLQTTAGVLAARNGPGQAFFYARHGRTAFLVWAKDAASAAGLLDRVRR